MNIGLRIKDPTFLRLAIANFMDSTHGKCQECQHNFLDVDDFINRNPILVKTDQDGRNYVMCEKCSKD